VKEHGLGLIIGRVPRGDRPRAVFARHACQESVAGEARRVFQGSSAGARSYILPSHDSVQSEALRERQDKLRVLFAPIA
jgi:hypothetical protein